MSGLEGERFQFVPSHRPGQWPVLTDTRCEWVWLPILGPTAIVVWRRLVYWCTLHGTFTTTRTRLAELTGVPASQVARTLQRLTDFGILHTVDDEVLEVMMAAPFPTEGQARRLPDDLRTMVLAERQRLVAEHAAPPQGG